MKKLFATAALAALLLATPAFAAPSVGDLLTQAQAQLNDNPAQAATLLEQVAAQSSTLTAEQAATVAAALQSINTWTQSGCAAATNACASIFTSMLTISSTPALTGQSPNLYSTILTSAQEFTNNAPKDNKKIAELEGFLQLAIGNQNPGNSAPLSSVATAD